MKSFYLTVLSWAMVCLCHAQVSPFIHVDQFGYLPSDSKVAVLSNPQLGYNAADSYSPPATLELRDASNDAVVMALTPIVWNGAAVHADSGDQGWWLDFSTFSTVGSYYIYDATNDERSAEFDINYTVYEDVLEAATKMYYYNRCNLAKVAPYADPNWIDGISFTNGLQDANCRDAFDQGNAATEKDLTGGWFDAGDYNKYVTFAYDVIHNLLWAYAENPDVFGDDWNIPESGNGVPDIIDEVVWELLWLQKMTNPDGTAHIKMGSVSYAENENAPPSANTDGRYYAPACTSASISIASNFAHAAKVLEGFPTYVALATQLENQAIASWNYVKPIADAGGLELNCDDGTVKSGDADRTTTEQEEMLFSAAVHLFDLTGNSTYNTHIINNYAAMEPMGGNWDAYKLSLIDALLHYTTISGNDNTVSTAVMNSITTASSNNWNGFFGFNSSDLYRAFVPNWTYHWGSNKPIAGYAVLNELLNKYNVNAANSAMYTQKSREQVHYFHGVNPQGLVYLSNMYDYGAERSANEIYHTWFNDGTDWDNAQTSLYGPAPGYVVGGANSSFTVGTISPPSGQPNMKAYLDFNTGWPDNSWEITEPSITYQAVYIRMLANAVETPIVLPIESIELSGENIQEKQIQLEFSVIGAVDVSHYIVQKYIENNQWRDLGRINADTSHHSYSFLDQGQIGRNIYRVKAMDLDGTTNYSNSINVLVKPLGDVILLYPNPAETSFSIVTELDILDLVLLDAKGRMVRILPVDSREVDVSDLPTGIYFAKISTTAGRVVRKLVVQ